MSTRHRVWDLLEEYVTARVSNKAPISGEWNDLRREISTLIQDQEELYRLQKLRASLRELVK